MESEEFSQTTADLARAVPCSEGLIRKYSDRGLLEHRRVAGMRVFKPSAATAVREILQQRLARAHRTGRRGPHAAA